MKQNQKKFLKIGAVCLLTAAVFCATCVGWLHFSVQQTAEPTDTAQESVPYRVPKATVLSVVFGEQTVCFALDFAVPTVRIFYGQSPADFTVTLHEDTVIGLVDRVGGLTVDGERLPGIVALERLQNDPEHSGELLMAFADRVAVCGLSRSDLIFLITSGTTDLTVPDVFDWQDFMQSCFENAQCDF